jgi:hypothetical protein
MERHHEARQAAQQAFLEALEQLREDLISGAESEAPAGVTSSVPQSPVPHAPPPNPATARSPAPAISPPNPAGITFDDLEAAIEDIEQYMHWQEEEADEGPDAEELDPPTMDDCEQEPTIETPAHPTP